MVTKQGQPNGGHKKAQNAQRKGDEAQADYLAEFYNVVVERPIEFIYYICAGGTSRL